MKNCTYESNLNNNSTMNITNDYVDYDQIDTDFMKNFQYYYNKLKCKLFLLCKYKNNETAVDNLEDWNSLSATTETKSISFDERLFLLIPLSFIIIMFLACLHIYCVKRRSRLVELRKAFDFLNGELSNLESSTKF